MLIGLLVLDTRFPRPPGDLAHPETFDFPVIREVVRRATPRRVVVDQAAGLLDAFVDAARRLEAAGARAIGTSCGFLALHQRSLAEAVRVPVFTSSLLQIPLVLASLASDRQVGVLTMDERALTPAHFAAVGIPSLDRVVVRGLEDAEAIYRPIMENGGDLDVARAEAQVVAAARDLVERHPRVGALVFECTNLPPYASAAQRATGLPVWDAVSLIRWARHAVCQPKYARASPARG